MNYLTKDDLLDLHIYAVTCYGGRLGIASQDRLGGRYVGGLIYLIHLLGGGRLNAASHTG